MTDQQAETVREIKRKRKLKRVDPDYALPDNVIPVLEWFKYGPKGRTVAEMEAR